MMLALFTAPDAMLLAALITAAGAYLHDRRKVSKKADEVAAKADEVAKQFTNNGGTTARDAIDRIEAAVTALSEKVDTELVPRLDHGATVMAQFADRLAVVEARPKNTRTRKDDLR